MFKNLTPHEIVIFVGEEKAEGKSLVVPKSDEVLRLGEIVVVKGNCDEGIPVVTKEYHLINLPPEVEGVNYLVAGIMLPYLPQERGDFLSPDTGEGSVVRDADGRIVGVRRLISHQK